MVNLVWLILIAGGFLVAALTGRVEMVTEAVMTSSRMAVETVIGFLGVIILWLGMMKIAEESGLIETLARLMQPLCHRVFPSVPRDHPAMGAIMMNLSANLLGLGHAATPLGLKAMQELQSLNRGDQETATDAMITFLALNTSSVTLIPATVIAFRAKAGSANPTEIVGTTLAATLVSTAVALAADYFLRTLNHRGSGPGSRR